MVGMNWEIVSIVALVLAGIAAVLTLVNLQVYRRLPARREGEFPRISVLIPARDEAANIAKLDPVPERR